MNLGQHVQFADLVEQLREHVGRPQVRVFRLQIVFQQNQISILNIRDEVSHDDVRSFGRKQNENQEDHDDCQIIADDRFDRLAVLDVVVVQLDVAGGVL